MGQVGDRVIRCDRSLLGLWQSFARALRAHDERALYPPKDEQWCLSNIELDAELRGLLGAMLADREHVRTLTLARNGPEGAAFLCTMLESNPRIHNVFFVNNSIGSVDRFCAAIGWHSALESISLIDVGLNDEGKLSRVLSVSRNMTTLNLSDNGVGSIQAAETITRFLTGSNLKTLYLHENSFGDETADLFASALRSNSSLQELVLRNNKFTPHGKAIIINALFLTSSLNDVIESNHTCAVYLDAFSGTEDERSAINYGPNARLTKHQKLYAALYGAAGSVMKLFSADQLRHFPDVLPDFLEYLQDYYINDVPRAVKSHAMQYLQGYTEDDFEEVYAKQTILSAVFDVLRNCDWTNPYPVVH